MDKKKSLLSSVLVSLGIIFVLTTSCKKDDDDNITVTDIDGNAYHTVTIGTQVWTVENLKVTRYNDGTPIPNVTDEEEWHDLTTGACCYYDNNINNVDTLGMLYNWYAVETGKLCPEGCHVPSYDEWETLVEYLEDNGYGHEGISASVTKSLASDFGWIISDIPGCVGHDQASNNSSGFTALPGGLRRYSGTFEGINNEGYFWSFTKPEYDSDDSHVFGWAIYYFWPVTAYSVTIKNTGYSVRCIKD